MSSNPESSFPPSNGGASFHDTGAAGGAHSATAGVDGPAASAQNLLGRTVQGAHKTIDRLAEAAEPRLQQFQEGVSAATDAVQSRAGQLRDLGDEWAEGLRTTVRENPVASLAAALALGMLVSRLTRR